MEELEVLEEKLQRLSKLKTDTLVWQKKVLGYLVTYSIVLYLIAAALAYFKFFPEAKTRNEQFLLLLPFLVVPILIFLLRKVLTWWYHRKVVKGDQQLSKLREKKAKILDEVMEKETYKVAKQILDKYAPSKLQSPPRQMVGGPVRGPLGAPGPQAGSLPGGSEVRRRPLPAPLQQQKLGVRGPSPNPGPTGALALPAPGPGGSLASAPQPQPAGGAAPIIRHPGPAGIRAPGPPLPRPVLPRERGYLDKFVEYLVGDGPANRYALICRQCQSHNGMALREEFEYIAFRCCYCYYWNPARKQRPVAPRLPSPVVSSSAVSSDSSDQSGTESARNSRRSSVSTPHLSDREVEGEGGTESSANVNDITETPVPLNDAEIEVNLQTKESVEELDQVKGGDDEVENLDVTVKEENDEIEENEEELKTNLNPIEVLDTESNKIEEVESLKTLPIDDQMDIDS